MLIDLHCHILPDIDDGPSELKGALDIAKVLISCGFGTVVATPHALEQFAKPQIVSQRIAQLVEAMAMQRLRLELLQGAENRLSSEFMQQACSGDYRLGSTSYVLVETPFETAVPSFGDLLFRLRSKGVRPIIAHPERCAHFQSLERAQEAVHVGAILQLDLGSIVGQYGKLARKSAERLLNAGLFGVAATDLHSAEGAKPWLEKSLSLLQKTIGAQNFDLLLKTNPEKILRNEEIE
jgi:protein-tyrosine phosphatase